MAAASESMFLDFLSWRHRNQDLEESIQAENVFVCAWCGGNGEDEEEDGEECEACDGTGLPSSDDIKSGLMRLMREAYEKQLERDYRLAVRALEVVSG
ncbi:MAG: hypothetical protein H8J66_14780 [Nitrospira sp.]|nr:hypothetical protein [Nitrospira sp.]